MVPKHLDRDGRARMVDVGGKPATVRTAVASGRVRMKPPTLAAVLEGGLPKGDALAVARVAGLMAAKRVPDLIPLCHPIPVSGAEVRFAGDSHPDEDGLCRIDITASVRTMAPTGVEMEALTAVSVAALTLYDMCKSKDRDISIGEIMLLSKTGGRSGRYRRGEPARARTAPGVRRRSRRR